MKIKLFAIGIVVLLICVGLSGCNEQKNNIIGGWTHENVVIEFKENKEIIIASGTSKWTGTYTIDEQLIRMDFLNEATVMGFSSTSFVYKYQFENSEKLILISTMEGEKQTVWTRIK